MTSWRKCIKFCAVFIASTLLFQYYVKCDANYEKSSLSNPNIVSDYNPNLGSENPESFTIIPSKSIKPDLDEALNSQENEGNIDSVVYIKNLNKKLGEPSTVKLDDVSNEIKDKVTESLTSTDEIENTQSEKLTNQDNESNTSKYDPILLSLRSSMCQRESNSLAFQKCKTKTFNEPEDQLIKVNSNGYIGHGDFIKVDNMGKIIRDDLVIISDDDQQNTQEMEEYDDINIEEIVNSDYSGPSLPDCSEKAEIRDPILVVSTIDGQISGINYETGEVIWSHSTSSDGGPMLSSSMSKLEVSSRGEWVRLIPSLDGSIYRFDGEHVEALPVNADTFLHSSFKFSEDTIFSGGKFLELMGIHPQTGEIKYVCDKNGCPKNRSVADNRPTLVVRRISYNVRAIDPSAGTERWKFSVGRHDVNFAIGNCESLIKDVDTESLPYLHFILPEGNVFAMNKNSEIIWQQKLPSPILSAWSLINEELETINLFSSTSIPALVPNDRTGEDSVDSKREPSLYVGIHKGQLYVQENINSKEFGSVVQRFINTNAGVPKVQWQPYLATAVSRTPVIHHGAKNHPLLLDYDKKQQTNELVVRHTYDYPFDNGYYLFGEDFEMLLNDSDHWITSEDDNDEIPPISDSLLHRIYYHLAGRGVMFWELASTIVIIFICNVILFRRLVANNVLNLQRILNDVIFYMIAYILHNIFRENAQVVLIIQRMGLNIAPLAPPPPPATQPALPYESSEEKQPPAVETQRQDSCFSSRYISDYEPIRRLGKGGFGVVFQVKNKLDQNEYAVKRILLPSKESSAERVKREARALAKLDHTNIVRYFTSWLETPPLGWEEEADLWWKRSETLSQSLTEGEDEYTEQPFTEDVDYQGVQTERQPSLNNQISLSAVINKLNYNSELNIPPLKSIDNKKSSLCDDSSHSNSFGSDDDENNEDDKKEFSDEETNANYSNNNDDSSFDILFEDTDVDQIKGCTKQGMINEEAQKKSCNITENNNSKLISETRESSYSDSIVFENNSTEFSRDDPNILKGKTRESDHSDSIVFESRRGESTHSDSIVFENRTKESIRSDSIVFENRTGESIHDDSIVFSSRTSESAHSDSILFANSSAKKEVENENRKEGSKRIKSSSFSIAPCRQILNRRRINTHTGLTDHTDRPSSLVLKDVNKNSGNKYENKRSTENQPSSCNPRTYLYIQMELCQTSSLKDWLSINKIRDTGYMYSIFNDIVHAVEYVHDLALMHRDLKPSNIFFSLDGKIKIGDFGLVTTIEEESDALTPMIDDSSIQKTLHGQQQKTRNVGTTLYMSPEQFSGLSYTYKVDIFSLGLIFFEMLVPFSTEMERIDVMRKARDKEFPPEFCEKYPDVKDLLQLALHGNPNERLTTRGLRARKPLHSLQKDSENISSDEHFNLTRLKGHIRSSSGSFSFMHSTSVST